MIEHGLVGLQGWWLPVLYVVIMGHITNLCVTLYLHRSATHEGVVFHPAVTHFMRFWLWLTTSVVTKEWVACHRKHHAFSDREGDPHSPVQEGLLEIVFGGVFFYHEACKDQDMLDKYGKGTPEDWVEKNIYTGRHWWGVAAMLLVDVALFGAMWGLFAWVCMTVWLPIFGNVINGIGHALGYRNFDTKENSHNIIPLGIWIVGEELHNNHHADPKSANFRAKWYEFDIGWAYIKLLSWFKLANVLYARSLNARDFAEKYYAKAARAANAAAEEFTAAAGELKGKAARAANAAAEEISAAAGELKGKAARAANAAAEEITAAAGELKGKAARAAFSAAEELSARAGEIKTAAEQMGAGKTIRATE